MENQIVRHAILVRFQDDATEDQLQGVFTGLREMLPKIDGVIGFEYGSNNSPEGLNRGLTHIIVITFSSAQARDAYLSHPEHLNFAERIGRESIIRELLVLDYIPQNVGGRDT